MDQKIESVPILGTIYKGGKSAVSWISNKISGNALGTPYWKGGSTRINERGGEIINLPSGTQIIPHDISRKVAGDRSVTININVQGNMIGNKDYAREMGDMIVKRLIEAMDNC